ncbi:hypothetical protein ACWEU6_36145 [Streptosporangium sandarakinum]
MTGRPGRPSGLDLSKRASSLTPEELDWVIDALAVLAPEALAEALDRLDRHRAKASGAAPSVGGGPDIGDDAEEDYRREKNR